METNDQGLIPNFLFKIILAFLVVPLIFIFLFSFFLWHQGHPDSLSLNGYIEFSKPFRILELKVVLIRSLITGFVATLIAFITSYILVRSYKNNHILIYLTLLTLPFLVNESVRVFSWQTILSEYGIINKALSFIFTKEVHFFNSTNGLNILFVSTFSLIPFGIFINVLTLGRIDSNLWQASKDLGASEWKTFTRIAAPLGLQGFIFSLIVTFFVSLTLSSEVTYLGGDTKQSIRILINDLLSANKVGAVFSLGASLLTIAAISMVIVFFSSSLRKK